MRQTAIRLTLLVVGVTSTATAAAPPQASPAVRSGEVTAGRLAAPLAFEPNRGRAAGDVEYLARGEGYTVFLRPREATLALRHARRGEAGLVRVRFEGAGSAAALEPLDPLPGRSNYLVGHDPAQWRTGVPHYGKVRSRGATGIDLVFYGRERQLEYDLVVSPRADPKRLRMRVEGATVEGPNVHGDLVLRTPAGDLLLRKPVAFQLDGASERAVAVSYRVRRRHEVALEVARYDAARPLVIDPVLSYSTYLGGLDAEEGLAIAVDTGGNAYVTGSTASNDFPVRPDVPDTVPFPRLLCVDFGCAYQLERRGGKDAFVTKFSPTGTLVYSTYLGGTADDLGNAIAVDPDGNAYVAGETSSLDFPTTTGAFQTQGNCGIACTTDPPGMLHPDAFVAKLSADGTRLVYATYLGGGHADRARGIAVDPSGRAHVVGETRSSDFPTTDGAAQSALGGGTCFSDPCADAFVASLEADGSALSYSTYLGGGGEDVARAIATDEDGDAYVAGSTASSDFPTHGTCEAREVVPGHVEIVCFRPLQAALNSTGDPIGDVDAFVSKLAADGRIVWSTYLGGTHRDVANGIATRTVTSTKNGVTSSFTEVYVAGETLSADFPVKDAFQNVHAGGNTDAFVAKLSSVGSSLVYSTFLGGSASSLSGSGDTATAIAVDALGSAYVAGYTVSPRFASDASFPVIRPAQPTCGGCADALDDDAFVAKLDPAGSLSYATYLGGTRDDRASGIAVDVSGTAYVTGKTLPTFGAPDFPTVSAAQPARGGGVSDAFAAKLVDHVAASTDLAVTQSASPDPAGEGAELAYSVVVTNNGSTDAPGVALLETLPVEADFVSAAASTGGCAVTAAKKLICNLGTLAAGTQATVTIRVVPNKMAP
jgi:uncharacterized repeat protein (TIGR01451 family)